MVVTMPLPPKQLSPNARVHWAVKAKHVKGYRERAFVLGVPVRTRHLDGNSLISATVQCKFYFRDSRRRDGDNLLASMKACFDGLVDAGVFEDDCGLTHLPVVQSKDRENPRVEIHITP